MENVITGAAFGASLVASGIYQPQLLAMQFALKRWDMFQIFLTATGSTAFLVEVSRHLARGAAPQKPRGWSSIGLTSSALDGNLLGGLLLGAGMGLSSSCPGMSLVQLAIGVPSAGLIVAGGVLGGLAWSAALRPLAAKKEAALRQRLQAEDGKTTTSSPPPESLDLATRLGRTTTFLLFETALASALIMLARAGATAPPMTAIPPVLGGLLIGGAQLVSLVLRQSALGVSTCYEQLGDWAVYAWRQVVARRKPGREEATPSRPGASAIWFAVALVVGAGLLGRARPDLVASVAHQGHAYAIWGYGSDRREQVKALAGGFLMAVGSRTAGGCAAGHGISGIGLMSMSSMVTMACAFGAAIGVSSLGI